MGIKINSFFRPGKKGKEVDLIGGAGGRGVPPLGLKNLKISSVILSRPATLKGGGEYKGYAPCRRPLDVGLETAG